MAGTITLDIAAFRAMFPAYADETAYPDTLLDVQWGLAVCYVSDNNHGRLSEACRTRALYLMLAHLLDLGDRVNSGAPSGQVVGASEDGVSVSLTPPPNESQFSWWLNVTPYGQQLNSLLDVNSVGGFYAGGRPERRGFRRIGGGFG